MSAYRMVRTKLFRPDSQPTPGAPAQGEWINAEATAVLEAWGAFRALPAHLTPSAFGQASRQICRWRGVLPGDVRPEPGWELEVSGARYRVLTAAPSIGRTWRLDMQRVGKG